MTLIDLEQRTPEVVAPLVGYLESLGYKRVSIKPEILGDSATINHEYLHPQSGRIFSFRSVESLGIAAHIQKKENDEHFRLGDYLKQKTGKTFLSLTNRMAGESWDDYARRCVELIVELLKTDLNKVVTGKEWIHVPLDWSIAGR
jgi:hypothetical protein